MLTSSVWYGSGAAEPGVEAATPNGAATKAKAMLAKDAQTDAMLYVFLFFSFPCAFFLGIGL